jgi:ribonuclease PH
MTIDCDVLQADGGTRTASITGAYVALALAVRKMIAEKTASPRALQAQVAAISVGIAGGDEMLDLCYEEDSRAEVDFNVVMTDAGKFIEVQATAEGEPFTRDALDRLVNLARGGIEELFKIQTAVLRGE